MTTVNKYSAIFAVSEYGEYSTLIPIAQYIEAKFSLHPIFVFAPGYGQISEHGRMVEIQGWSWIQLGSKRQSLRTDVDEASYDGYFPTQGSRVRGKSDLNLNTDRQSWLLKYCMMPTLVALGGIRVLWRIFKNSVGAMKYTIRTPHAEFSHQVRQARRIFDQSRPKIVISGQDYVLSVTSIISAVANEAGVSTIIIPFSMPPTTKEIIESFSYLGHNRVSGLALMIAKKLIPKWIQEHRRSFYTRASPLAALASDALGLTPPQPWVPNSGRGVICCPSDWARRYYEEAGISRDQLVVTGAIWSDKIINGKSTKEFRKKRLIESLSHRKAESGPQHRSALRLIIVSWPPNQYPRQAVGCTTYEDLCDQYILALQELRSTGRAHVAISLHPTLTDNRLLKKLQKAKLHILRNSLLEVIDCADIFVATVSSTIFWALQSGTPAINFDGYLYGYKEFDSAGALTVRSPFDIYVVCRKIMEDKEFEAETVDRITNCSGSFYEGGGINSSRIFDLIESHIKLS
jgi:hypothetical protein